MDGNFQEQIKALGRLLALFGVFLVLSITGVFYLKNNPDIFNGDKEYLEVDSEQITAIELDEETILQSGFVNDEGVSQVIQNCTQCHSAKLVTQNKMSKEGWEATIIWMQETQNLWDLGANQERIVGYLAKNYGPKSKGRRQNLTKVEWYELR